MYTWILVFFTVFLKNRNIISKIKRSKVTDYAALRPIIAKCRSKVLQNAPSAILLACIKGGAFSHSAILLACIKGGAFCNTFGMH